MKTYLKFKTWLQSVILKVINNSVYLWLFHSLNVWKALALFITLNLMTLISGNWFDYGLNVGLLIIAFFDYVGYLSKK